jgi:putative flippase GtrA
MTALPTKAAHTPVRFNSPPGFRSSNLSGIVQALRFGIVGLSNTLVDAVLYLVLTRGLPFFALYPALAKALSYSAGVINSFYWNKNWTFRSRIERPAWKAFLPFVLVNLLGVLINAGIMQMCLRLLRLDETLAFISATGVTLVWNFLASKFIVFRNV